MPRIMPEVSSPFPPGSQWDACYLAWMRALWNKSQSASTIRNYGIVFRAFTRSIPPGLVLTQVNRQQVEAFVYASTMWGMPPSPATINQRLSTLTSFYRFASEYLMNGVPLFDGRLPTMGLHHAKRRRVYRYLTADELERFFAAIPTDDLRGIRDRAIFLMYFWTARRREEIARLTWGDLFQGVIVSEDGKSRRAGWLYRFYGKGQGEQEDVAELPGPAKDALDRYLLASGRMSSMQANSPLFTHIDHTGVPKRMQDRERPLGGAAIRRRLKIYAERAGLDAARLCVHSLRHTAARERYAAGEDLRSISRLLRHSSIGITDVYLSQMFGTEDSGASLLEQQWRHLSAGGE